MADLTVTAANVVSGAGAATRSGVAGATITAGQPLYQDGADAFSLKPAQADATDSDIVVGIALHGAADGQPITYQTGGVINLGATLTVGEVYVLSAAAAGGIAPVGDLTSGNFVSVIGVATTAALLQMGIINSGVAVPT